MTRRWSIKTLLATTLPLVLLTLSFLSLATLINDSALFDRYRLLLLGFNIVSIVIFFILIVTNISSLWRRLRRNEAGSRLSLKFVKQFLPVAIIPAVALYIFSYWAVDRGIESWFSVNLNEAFDSAIKLGRLSLDTHLDQRRRQIEPLLVELYSVPDDLEQSMLSSILNRSGADELVLLSSNQRVKSAAGTDLDRPLPELIPPGALSEIAEDKPYLSIDTLSDGGLYARMIFLLPASEIFSEPRYLQALFRMSERINFLAGSVQESYRQYNQLDYQRTALKRNFILTLNLTLLLGVFYVMWLAFRSSHKLMRPIVQLSDATQSIAEGNLNIKLDPSPNDDLGFLSSSFSTMAGALSQARSRDEASQLQIESQRAYLSAIIERVDSGVLTMDSQFKLITANKAAENILGVALSSLYEQALCSPDAPAPALVLCNQFPDNAQAWEKGWHSEFKLTHRNENKTISCYGASLSRGDDASSLGDGMVIVFSDVSQLVQAQRNIVWREAAQRFAHEIKNPLTPIQLAIERLRNKLSNQLEEDNRQLLNTTANTITQQVEAMKGMVDNLRNYASDVPPDLTPLSLNRIVQEVASLYRFETSELHLALDGSDPLISGNDLQLRQLLHNLIKNALEAMAQKAQKHFSIETTITEDKHHVVLKVQDNGDGFPPEVRETIFEPYVSTKKGGSGLGLAVVKRIVSAHNGEIVTGNIEDNGGAYVSITFQKV